MEEARGAQLAAAGSRELEASRRALATLAGRTVRIVSEVSAYQCRVYIEPRRGTARVEKSLSLRPYSYPVPQTKAVCMR